MRSTSARVLARLALASLPLLTPHAALRAGGPPVPIFAADFESGSVAGWSQVLGLASCTAGTPVIGAAAGDLGPAPPGPFTELTCVEIRNDQSVDRSGETAFSGIPLPAALGLTAVSELALIGPGERRLAAQLDVLSRWGGPLDDLTRPIRWLQVAVQPQLGPLGTAVYSLRRYPGLSAASDPFAATILPQGGGFVVDTGLATFTLDPTSPALLTAIAIDLDGDGQGRTPVYSHSPGAGPRLVFAGPSGDVTLSTAGAGQVNVDPGGWRIVEGGPVKVVVALDGHFSAPGGASLCLASNPAYERFGYTAVATFHRASRHLDLELHLRNECSDAFSGPWTDDAVTVRLASWELPLNLANATVYAAGGGAVLASSPGFSGLTLVEQRKGGGSPWRRRARVLRGATTLESGEAFDRPLVAVGNATVLAAAQLPWMRYREPQALAVDGTTLSLRLVSEQLVVGEGKGLWQPARILLLPAGAGAAATQLEALRGPTTAALERGLLVRAPLPQVNAAGLWPSLGTAAPSPLKSAYLATLNALHEQTVGAGGQWHRAKTFGSQLWPDVPADLWSIDNPEPAQNSGAMNYWNPSGVELLELLRTGEPRWAWDFALPQSWLQAYTAYLNLGSRHHGNRAGMAVTSGGSGEGQWHRSAFGSDDYSYNAGLQLAYALRPAVALRDRFAQAGRTVLERYNVPRASQQDREPFVNQVDITRQVIQHFEMLANCAEFVPGQRGQDCHDHLQELLTELAEDNLRAGVLCAGDIPSATTCPQPQQFMQNALHYLFFHRLYRSYGNVAGQLRRALVEAPQVFYQQGMAHGPDGVSLDVDADWAALLECALNGGGTQVTSCTWVPNSDGLALLRPNKPHSVALLLMADELDPSAGLCQIARDAFDDPALTDTWLDYQGNSSGWWKGADQMMQGMAFAVGLYDTCTPSRTEN